MISSISSHDGSATRFKLFFFAMRALSLINRGVGFIWGGHGVLKKKSLKLHVYACASEGVFGVVTLLVGENN